MGVNTSAPRHPSLTRRASTVRTGSFTAQLAHSEYITNLNHFRSLCRYNKLSQTGNLHPILRDPNLEATRPFLETDIRAAIQSLETSTATIQKQSDTLSRQCDILRKQFRQRESLDGDRGRDIMRLRKKHEVGRQNTIIAVRAHYILPPKLYGGWAGLHTRAVRMLSS